MAWLCKRVTVPPIIKYLRDKKKLSEITKAVRERFETLEKRAVDLIEAVTGCGLKYEEGAEKINMCRAIQEIRQEAYDQGKVEGRLEGGQEAYNQGKIEGEQEGILKKAKEMARNFYEMGFDIGKIAQGVGYSSDIVRQWLGLSNASQLP